MGIMVFIKEMCNCSALFQNVKAMGLRASGSEGFIV